MEKRGWLEVLKFLGPRDLLAVDSVCRRLKEWCSYDETWRHHLIMRRNDESISARTACQAQLPRSRAIADVNSYGIVVYYPTACKQKRSRAALGFVPRKNATWALWRDSLVFYCGGEGHSGEPQDDCFLLNVYSEEARVLPPMKRGRSGAGLIFIYGKVFVFGGITGTGCGSGLVATAECAKLDIAAAKWTDLPKMGTPRARFVPARLKSRVYLAGGIRADNYVDVFSLKKDAFLVSVPLACNVSDSPASAYFRSDSLVIVSGFTVWECDIRTGVATNQSAIVIDESFTWTAPLVEGGEAYFVLAEEGLHRLSGNWDFGQATN